jgi:predicted secreted Zn-dependent protease
MAGTKVKVKTTWGSKSTSKSIKITAETLGDALKALQGLDEWGQFDGTIDHDYDTANDVVTQVTLKPSYKIQMPEWSGYSKAPKACQKEWDRMWKKLEEHEDGHRQVHQKTLTDLEASLKKKTDLTEDQWNKEFDAAIKKMQEDQKKFDSDTDHGAKKGVELNVSEECA